MVTPIEPSAGAAPSPTNSAPPPARWLSAAGALVGVGMFLGALAVLALLVAESRGAPDAPVSTDAAHLAEAVRGGATWVSIADATEPCRYTAFTTSDTSLVYGITGGPGVDVVALTETREARACHDARGPMVGTARLSPLDVFEGTGLGFAAFARPYVGDQLVILEPGDDPRLSWTGVALLGAMALMGLVIAWFYGSAFWVRASSVRLGPTAARPELPLLPQRPLTLARRYRGSVALAMGFLSVSTLLFGAMTASQWPAGGLAALDGGTIALMAFSAVMTALFAVLTGAILRTAVRQRHGVARLAEAWGAVVSLEAMLAKGVDVGNRVLAYESPFRDGALVELSVGANEGAPWIVEGHVLVARDEGSAVEYVVRVDGGPFALTDAELARLAG